LSTDQSQRFGGNPTADGEVRSFKTKQQRPDDGRNRCCEQARQWNRKHGIDPQQGDDPKQRVGAEPDERLLSNRDQPAPPGKHVPELREREHRKDEDEILDQVPRRDHWQQ